MSQKNRLIPSCPHTGECVLIVLRDSSAQKRLRKQCLRALVTEQSDKGALPGLVMHRENCLGPGLSKGLGYTDLALSPEPWFLVTKPQQPMEQLVRQQWIDQEASLKGVPRPWGFTVSSVLPGSAGSVLEPSILPVPKGQWYIATWLRWNSCKASPGLVSLAEVGERAWVPDTQAVWMARPRSRWLWGAVASRMSKGQ